jgi:glucokinase
MRPSTPHQQAGIGPGLPVLAFDVGGTDIKAALFDAQGAPLGLRRTPTPLAGLDTPRVLAARLAELDHELRAVPPGIQPEAAGLLVPGIVDAERGVGVYATNMGWRDAPLRDIAATALRLPVAFDHDVHAAGLAELRLGAALGYDDVVVLVIGTGIAGSVIIGGRTHRAGGYAGEIGHSPVADGPVCACGATGCLEAVASAGAIVRRYAERTGGDPRAPGFGAREVLGRARQGDQDAALVWEAALDALTLTVAELTAFLAPQAVVIGGGLSRAGDDLFAPLRERVDARLSFHRRAAIVPAQLGGDAGLLGAGLLARERTVGSDEAVRGRTSHPGTLRR